MLTGLEIIHRRNLGEITIEPFDEKSVGPNSYDLRISSIVKKVMPNSHSNMKGRFIDTSKASSINDWFSLIDGDIWLDPGETYLGYTEETIGSELYVPTIHGRSSSARHGLMIHFAGLGDLGWKGQVVLELVNLTKYPMAIRPGVRVGQVCFHPVTGDIKLYNSTYQNQTGITPAKALT